MEIPGPLKGLLAVCTCAPLVEHLEKLRHMVRCNGSASLTVPDIDYRWCNNERIVLTECGRLLAVAFARFQNVPKAPF